MTDYQKLIYQRRKFNESTGMAPVWMPDSLFPFQRNLVEWALGKGRGAIFADCGMGKTAMQLVWAQNIVQATNRPVLVLTPLAVGPQTVNEGKKFGVECVRSLDGKVRKTCVVVANYERIHLFDPADFSGVVCDESSILKNYAGAMRSRIIEFMSGIPYRLLCTATPSPNDFVELGNSAEALGVMRRAEMMAQYFVHDGGETSKWRIKGHAAKSVFWTWVCSWARACRMPSDMGYSDDGYVLPPLTMREHVVSSQTVSDDLLFDLPAVTLDEQRKERRRTIHERCGKVADLVKDTGRPALCFCHLNDEGKELAGMIPGAVEVSGADSDESKEEKFAAFVSGGIRVMVTKPKIAGMGLNFQHCAHQTYFPSHSFEEMYQSVRRCWRFGQNREVTVDMVASEGESNVMRNLDRKIKQSEEMFSGLVRMMNITAPERAVVPPIPEIHVPVWAA